MDGAPSAVPTGTPTVSALPSPVLGFGDVAVVVIYLVILLALSLGASREQAQGLARGEGAAAYFLARRNMHGGIVGLSLFVASFDSGHFVGLAASAAKDGLAPATIELFGVPLVVLLGFVFLPVYTGAKVATTPEYVGLRYSAACRSVMVCVSLLLYVLTRLSAALYVSELVLVDFLEIDRFGAVVLVLLLATLYTVFGGLQAVLLTDTLQSAALVLGCLIVLGFALREAGGGAALRSELDPIMLQPFQPVNHELYPWTGVVLGYPICAAWFWCVDQVVVQRALAARGLKHGQAGVLTAALLKILGLAMVVAAGLCARKIMKDWGEDLEHLNAAFPWLVLNTVPQHARGPMVAAMIAALMSSLASVFNSSAMLFALDVWKPLRSQASQKELILVGRVVIGVAALLALCWTPIMPLLGPRLFIVLQKPPAFLAPPLVAVVFWGAILRFPHPGAGIWTFAIGLSFGFCRLILECVEAVLDDIEFGYFTKINFLHFAAISFAASSLTLFCASLILRMCVSQGPLDRTDTSGSFSSTQAADEEADDDSLDHRGPQPETTRLVFHRHLSQELMFDDPVGPRRRSSSGSHAGAGSEDLAEGAEPATSSSKLFVELPPRRQSDLGGDFHSLLDASAASASAAAAEFAEVREAGLDAAPATRCLALRADAVLAVGAVVVLAVWVAAVALLAAAGTLAPP